jgi:hypothetical protein
MTTTNPAPNTSQDLSTSSIVEAYFQGTETVCQFVVSVIEPILGGQLGLNDRQIAIVGTYLRIIAWLKALAQLNSLPHYQAVAAATRSLYELLLDIKLLQSDVTGDLVKKFHAFPQVEKYRAARNLVSFCDKNPNTGIECTNQRTFVDGPTKEAAINSIVTTHWGTNKNNKPKRPDHWSGMTIRERAERLGQQYE